MKYERKIWQGAIRKQCEEMYLCVVAKLKDYYMITLTYRGQVCTSFSRFLDEWKQRIKHAHT